jgi:hypothetical protein
MTGFLRDFLSPIFVAALAWVPTIAVQSKPVLHQIARVDAAPTSGHELTATDLDASFLPAGFPVYRLTVIEARAP